MNVELTLVFRGNWTKIKLRTLLNLNLDNNYCNHNKENNNYKKWENLNKIIAIKDFYNYKTLKKYSRKKKHKRGIAT